jgi:hypothetical protein
MKGDDGKTMGDAFGSTDHLLSHMEERYYVPALLYNAFMEQPHAPMEENLLAILCNPESSEKDVAFAKVDSMQQYIKHGVERVITKYLKQRLAL